MGAGSENAHGLDETNKVSHAQLPACPLSSTPAAAAPPSIEPPLPAHRTMSDDAELDMSAMGFSSFSGVVKPKKTALARNTAQQQQQQQHASGSNQAQPGQHGLPDIPYQPGGAPGGSSGRGGRGARNGRGGGNGGQRGRGGRSGGGGAGGGREGQGQGGNKVSTGTPTPLLALPLRPAKLTDDALPPTAPEDGRRTLVERRRRSRAELRAPAAGLPQRCEPALVIVASGPPADPALYARRLVLRGPLGEAVCGAGEQGLSARGRSSRPHLVEAALPDGRVRTTACRTGSRAWSSGTTPSAQVTDDPPRIAGR